MNREEKYETQDQQKHGVRSLHPRAAIGLTGLQSGPPSKICPYPVVTTIERPAGAPLLNIVEPLCGQREWRFVVALLWGKSRSGAPREKPRAGRSHLYLVPKTRRTGSLLDALSEAGYEHGPREPKPQVSPEVIAQRIAQREGDEARELAQRYAPGKKAGPNLPDYWKSARRARWRDALHSVVAWTATIVIVAAIVAAAAHVLVGPALRGDPPFVARE
jgi:hypothetical protein